MFKIIFGFIGRTTLNLIKLILSIVSEPLELICEGLAKICMTSVIFAIIYQIVFMIRNKTFDIWSGLRMGLILFVTSIVLGILGVVFKKINKWINYPHCRKPQKVESEETTTNKPNTTQEPIEMWFEGCENIEEIKGRYKQLAKVLHPDNCGDDKAYKSMCSEYKAIIKQYN